MAEVKMYKCENCGNLNTHKDSYDDRYCYDCIDMDTGELKKDLSLKEDREVNNITERILATSGDGKGLLPMKQGDEQESKKTEDIKNIEVCNFIKNAFCIDGDVEMRSAVIPVMSNIFFICNDSRSTIRNDNSMLSKRRRKRRLGRIMETLNDNELTLKEINNLLPEDTKDTFFHAGKVKDAIKEAYLGMPWATLSPLGKKAIEVAFKDSFGLNHDAILGDKE